MTIRDYAWAQRQLFQGHRVRRQSWPTYNFPPGTGFDPEDPYWAIWHIWKDGASVRQGWGGAGSAYFYPWLGRDNSRYLPSSHDDKAATDWELYEDRLDHPELAAREPAYRPQPESEHFYPWPAYLAVAAFITALMVGAILYLPWK